MPAVEWGILSPFQHDLARTGAAVGAVLHDRLAVDKDVDDAGRTEVGLRLVHAQRAEVSTVTSALYPGFK